MRNLTSAREPHHVSRARVPFFASTESRKRPVASLPFFQPKLEIGAPNDRFEREADRVADQIVAGGQAPSVQRMCDGCAEERKEDDELLQTKRQQRTIGIATAPAGVVQREDEDEDKDPLTEGAKLTAGKALEKPEVKKAAKEVWEGLPANARAGLMTVGGVSLGAAYISMILSAKMQEKFSGVDIGKPLSLIPYVPLEGFKYKLPVPGKSGLSLSAEFGFEDYFSLIRRHLPRFPISNLTFGLEGTLAPKGSFGITGGKGALELFGGVLKAEAKTFTKLSPYPLLLPGSGFDPPSRLMQSYPGLPSTETGFGAQATLSVDLAKIFPGILGGGVSF